MIFCFLFELILCKSSINQGYNISVHIQLNVAEGFSRPKVGYKWSLKTCATLVGTVAADPTKFYGSGTRSVGQATSPAGDTT